MIQIKNPESTNKNGLNASIKYNILNDEAMENIGFTQYRPGYWYYCKNVGKSITFNVTIPIYGSEDEFRIDVLDEYCLHPYDYQYYIEKGVKFAEDVWERVEKQMEYLKSAGVLSGHNRGDYI